MSSDGYVSSFEVGAVGPELRILVPAEGDSIAGAAVTFTAHLQALRPIGRVAFLVDDTEVGSVTSPPYTIDLDASIYQDVPVVLGVKAYDTRGNELQDLQAQVTVTVANGPPEPPPPPLTVALTSPADGATITNGLVTITANAGGNVARVEFRIRGVKVLPDDTTAPYAANSGAPVDVSQLSDGSAAIEARAVEVGTGLTVISTRTVTIDNPDPTTVAPLFYDEVAFPGNILLDDAHALHSRSADMVTRMKAVHDAYSIRLIYKDNTPPLWEVTSADPFYNGNVGGSLRFRIPTAAINGSKPFNGAGDDRPVEIIDRNHPDFPGRVVELRLFRGSIDTAAKTFTGEGQGLYYADNQSSADAHPFRGTGTGSDLSYLAGMILAREYQAGVIRHAIRISYDSSSFVGQKQGEATPSNPGWVWPAEKSDQRQINTGVPPAAQRVPMGQLFRLPHTFDPTTRTVKGKSNTSNETRLLRMICTAIRDYGLLICDGTTGGIAMYMEHETTALWNTIVGPESAGSYGNVIRTQGSLAGGYAASDGIPWGSLQALVPYS